MSALRTFDKRFKNAPPPEKYLHGHFSCEYFAILTLPCLSEKFILKNVFTAGVSADDIYYHRELAINSLDGRRLDLLTISSHHGITPHREPRFKNLFPDLETPRPHIFVGKKVSYVSPGLIQFTHAQSRK